MAGARALWRATGMTDADFGKPIVAIANSYTQFVPGHVHLKNLGARPWLVAALASWGIALFEYLLQVPANRIGYTAMSLTQLKVLQEADSPDRAHNRDKRNQLFRGNREGQVSHKRNQCRGSQVLFLKESNGQVLATKAWLCPVTTSKKQRKPSKQKD